MAGSEAGGRREQILQIAQGLFARQGYAGTSIADIAGLLGTSKAAMYYHFTSKEDILAAILEKPLTSYAELAELAATRPSVEKLVGAVIDLTAAEGVDFASLTNDPSIHALMNEHVERHDLVAKIEQIVGALAGPDPSPTRLVVARAAFSAAKDGTIAAMTSPGGVPFRAEYREALLTAVVRMLEPQG